jgi:hypothetical protein
MNAKDIRSRGGLDMYFSQLRAQDIRAVTSLLVEAQQVIPIKAGAADGTARFTPPSRPRRHVPAVTSPPSRPRRHVPAVTSPPSRPRRHVPAVTSPPSRPRRHVPAVTSPPSRPRRHVLFLDPPRAKRSNPKNSLGQVHPTARSKRLCRPEVHTTRSRSKPKVPSRTVLEKIKYQPAPDTFPPAVPSAPACGFHSLYNSIL